MNIADGVTDQGDPDGLPYIDTHTITIAASRAVVWTALQRYVAVLLRGVERGPLAKILGTQPPAGFEVSESRPVESLTLVGRHRFSRYRLVFELAEPSDGTTRLAAKTNATFPGVHGFAYRTLVIGTRAHVIATRHMLGSIRRLADEVDAAQGPTT